jgi:hypothetical protein
MGFEMLAQRHYDEAYELRKGYVGFPTDEQIRRQRAAGWEFTGSLDEKGRPQWNYDPDIWLFLRDRILLACDPFSFRPTGEPWRDPLEL